MTRGRYEIEFQGSNDGQHWTTYPFRYKPQALNAPPRIYAPYQPRFDWNLWFASLGTWRENNIVPITEERLLAGSPDMLKAFSRQPIPQHSAEAGAGGVVAVLVYMDCGKACDGFGGPANRSGFTRRSWRPDPTARFLWFRGRSCRHGSESVCDSP